MLYAWARSPECLVQAEAEGKTLESISFVASKTFTGGRVVTCAPFELVES